MINMKCRPFSYLFGILFILLACSPEESKKPTATIAGDISVIGFGSTLGGIKLTLQNASDDSDISIAFSESDGSFVFNNVEEGYYFLTPTKDGYSWTWTVVDGNEPIHKNSGDKRIKIEAGELVHVNVLMAGPGAGSLTLTILDPHGHPINKLDINQNVGSISFVLFNGTGAKLPFSVDCRCLFSSRLDAFYLFNSINPTSGELEPGESIPITCKIDLRAYSSTLSLYDDITIYTGMSRLVLPLSLNWDCF